MKTDFIDQAAEIVIRSAERRLKVIYGCGVTITTELHPVSITTSEEITDTVAMVWGVTAHSMRSKTRKREVVEARQIAMVLCMVFLKSTLAATGQKFGGRDHSTVIHAKRVVQDMLDTDASYRVKYKRCYKMIEARVQRPRGEIKLLPASA
jgi:hypothetical protein